jgi:hypothetical protein
MGSACPHGAPHRREWYGKRNAGQIHTRSGLPERGAYTDAKTLKKGVFEQAVAKDLIIQALERAGSRVAVTRLSFGENPGLLVISPNGLFFQPNSDTKE